MSLDRASPKALGTTPNPVGTSVIGNGGTAGAGTAQIFIIDCEQFVLGGSVALADGTADGDSGFQPVPTGEERHTFSVSGFARADHAAGIAHLGAGPGDGGGFLGLILSPSRGVRGQAVIAQYQIGRWRRTDGHLPVSVRGAWRGRPEEFTP